MENMMKVIKYFLSHPSNLVLGEVVKQLSDLVVEEILPQQPGPGHALLEAVRLLLDDQPEDGLHGLQGLGPRQGHRLLLELRILDVLAGGEGSLGELALEHVPGPLKSVLNCVREIFQRANGNRLLRGILGGGVALSHLQSGL